MIATLPMMPTTQVAGPPMEPIAPPPISWKSRSSPDTAAPLERYHTKPRIVSRPPSVTMNEGTPT